MSQQDPNQPAPDPYAPPTPEGTPAGGAAPTPPPYAGYEGGYPGQEGSGQPVQPGYPTQPGYPAQPGYPGAPVYPGRPGDVDPGRGIGIAGFVCAFFVPVVGIILSAIGLSKSRGAGRKNPLAAWGLGLSIFFTVAFAAIVVSVFASHGDDIADAVKGANDPTTRRFCQADARLTKEMNVLQDPSSMETQDYAQGLLDAKDDLDGVVAPDEIATDWKAVVSFFDKIVAPLEGVDTSDEAAVKQALGSSGLTQADLTTVQGAGSRVDDWASTHCAAVPVD
ncbi:hypothetical protein GCM10025864_07600 [Luteimicrobium album]|uniref:DUF4190 domain-containing protein n=1 Tax=Luteimicrobium album TaxID=1054550 RepID=A0ABQ6HX19_9MICO|nr:hypothetical protein [Luteimicrobium album]GMA23001.1 hypothetical protein GCM10025864_07600 [Luteimicrobium album]